MLHICLAVTLAPLGWLLATRPTAPRTPTREATGAALQTTGLGPGGVCNPDLPSYGT